LSSLKSTLSSAFTLKVVGVLPCSSPLINTNAPEGLDSKRTDLLEPVKIEAQEDKSNKREPVKINFFIVKKVFKNCNIKNSPG
jgi:hypothetical protein